MRLLALCSFANRFDNAPRQLAEVTWDELVRRLTRHREWVDRDGELWSPTEYLPGTLRAKENVAHLDCFVLDMDSGEAWEPYLERWQDLEFILHTTYRHTADAPRWRAVFPLVHRQPGGEAWGAVWERLAWGLASHTSDAHCKDAGRMYYLPAHPPGSVDHFALRHEGAWLDADSYAEMPPPPAAVTAPRARVFTPHAPRESSGRVDGSHLDRKSVV